MQQDRTSLIRERAYAIWNEAGQPEGEADAHWAQAEAELNAPDDSPTAAPATEAEEPVGAEEAPVAAASPAEPEIVATPEPVAAPAPAPAKKPVRRGVKNVTTAS